MKNFKAIVCSSLMLATVLFAGCNKAPQAEFDEQEQNSARYGLDEKVVVANRGGSSISFIDVNTMSVTDSLTIPDSEPMYIVYVKSQDMLYVGDRKNNKVVIVDPKTRKVAGSIVVGSGVFHMWADGLGKQLWVNNDIDKTISVIDLSKNVVINTIKLDLKPHDVFLTRDGRKAYVSVFSADPKIADSIYSFSTTTFEKTASKGVGKDPHLFHSFSLNTLFVPCQSGDLYTLNGNNLSEIAKTPLEGAHGIFSTLNQTNLFITNISGNQIYSFNGLNSKLNMTVTSKEKTPHNIVVDFRGTKMFVSHSGPTANTVSIYPLNYNRIGEGKSITVGKNPFGIAYYVRFSR